MTAAANVPQLMMTESFHHRPLGRAPSCHLLDGKGYGDGNERRNPDQSGQRVLEIDLLLTPLRGAGENTIDPVGDNGRDDHKDTHDEYPDQELSLKGLIVRTLSAGQHDEADDGNTGNAIGLKTVRRGAHTVASIVAGAVRDNAGVARVVFFDGEDDLHQVGADISDLGEDTAADTKGRSAQ